MDSNLVPLADQFKAVLEEYLAGVQEAALARAYELGRNALATGLGVLDMLEVHQLVLSALTARVGAAADDTRLINAAGAVFSEILAPFEMANRGLHETYAELRRLNATLQEKADEAQEAREAADKANQAKSEFLSRMSHELRTPLNAVLGFAQLLDMDNLGAEQRDHVGQILRAGRHLLNLINEVLDIARIEAGRLAVSLEPVCVADVVEESLGLIAPLASERGLQLDRGLAASRDLHIRADRQRLTQVLLNLLSNAVKYNRKGGTVAIASAQVPGGRLRVGVRDTGRGIPAELMARLFTPFERLGSDIGIEGTGLGLALSKRLVEAMGGELGLETAVGVGSHFWMEFPQVESPVQATVLEEYLGPVLAEKEAPVHERIIVYIEDNLSNLKLVEQLLARRPNLRLIPAMQGRLGIDLASKHRPDLILLDLHLPDASGEEVLRQLREGPETQDIPVVILTADATSGRVQQLLEAGANAYLTKPLDIRKFLSTVDGFLRAREASNIPQPSTNDAP